MPEDIFTEDSEFEENKSILRQDGSSMTTPRTANHGTGLESAISSWKKKHRLSRLRRTPNPTMHFSAWALGTYFHPAF